MSNEYIIGSGMATAGRAVSNQDLCDMFPTLVTSDAWLRKNVGIRNRYFAEDGERLVDTLVKAGREAIKEAGVDKIDRIIVGSNSQDRSFPASACEVAKGVKDLVDLSTVWCFDVQNGCPGGLAAIYLGIDAVRSQQCETVLAIGGDHTSRILDMFDRNTSMLLGDGASAFVITTKENSEKGGISLKILARLGQCDYESSEIMTCESGTSEYSPFTLSEKTRDLALEAVRRITGADRIPENITHEQEEELIEAGRELKKIAIPPHGNAPYHEDHNPFFRMAGAEVLEKIRRLVPDCGYLPTLRLAGVGLDLFEEYDLFTVNRVSDIPGKIKREFLQKLQERFELFIPHQANMRGHQNLSAALKIPMNKIYSNIQEYGNTSGGATGIALYEALRKPSRYRTIRGDRVEIETPMFEKGKKAVVVSFGAGMNVVFIVLERLK